MALNKPTNPRPIERPNPMRGQKPSSHLKNVLFGAPKDSVKKNSLGRNGKKYQFPGQKPERISLGRAIGGVLGGMPVRKKAGIKTDGKNSAKQKPEEKSSPFSGYFKRNALERELEKAEYYDPKHFKKKEERKALVKKWFDWKKFPKHDISQQDVFRARKDLEKEYWVARNDPTKRWKVEREKELFEKEFGKKK